MKVGWRLDEGWMAAPCSASSDLASGRGGGASDMKPIGEETFQAGDDVSRTRGAVGELKHVAAQKTPKRW